MKINFKIIFTTFLIKLFKNVYHLKKINFINPAFILNAFDFI